MRCGLIVLRNKFKKKPHRENQCSITCQRKKNLRDLICSHTCRIALVLMERESVRVLKIEKNMDDDGRKTCIDKSNVYPEQERRRRRKSDHVT